MKLAIYHTTDIHGYIFPTNYVEYKNIGLLKILSYIKEDKKNYDQSLLLEGGDLIQGSAMTNYLSKNLLDSNPILDLTQLAEYDAYVLGNHEFNYGKEYLTKSYKQVENKLLASNIEGLDLEAKPYKIFNLDGYKVGVIGMTTSYIPNWEQKENIKGISFFNPIKLYAKYENELKEKSDLIIVLYHGGFEKSLDVKFSPTERLNGENQASELLERFDSIDIILSGHQHRSFITKINNTICSQPTNNAKNFTKIVIDTDINRIDYELIEIDEIDIEINKDYEKIFDEVNNNLKVYLEKVIGELNKPVILNDHFNVRLNGSPYINLLQKIQIEATGADFSSTTLFDTAIGFEKDISIRDVIINYPYPNSLKVLKITGHNLKKAIEISSTYFVLDENDNVIINSKYLTPKVRHYIYDFYYGFDYVVDISRDFGDRVVSMSKDGKDLDLDKEYTIVVNNYRASNINEYPCYEGKEIVKEVNKEMSELIIDYILDNKYLKLDENINFKFIR